MVNDYSFSECCISRRYLFAVCLQNAKIGSFDMVNDILFQNVARDLFKKKDLCNNPETWVCMTGVVNFSPNKDRLCGSQCTSVVGMGAGTLMNSACVKCGFLPLS